MACALLHIIGQGANLLFQILLARRFGLAAYGEIGLAHLLFVLVCFVADLGYSSVFLRQPPGGAGWSRTWRIALGHRLVAVLVFHGAALVGWTLAYGVRGDGFAYLVATLPGALFSVSAIWPALLARGGRFSAFCVQQVPWPAALLLWGAFAGSEPTAAGAGAAVTAGFAVQFGLSVAIWRRPGDWRPVFAWSGGLLRSAFSLSVIAIAGAAHDRLTPFLLAQLAPDFLPVLLLVGHGLSGVSGVAAQVNRLLLPRITSPVGLRWSLRLAAAALTGSALLLQAFLTVGLLTPTGLAGLHPTFLLPSVLAWAIATTSGFAAVEMIGRNREARLAGIILIGLAASASLQIAATMADSAEGVVWARALALMAIAGASLRACGIALAFPGVALCGASMSAALVPRWPWLWPVSGALLVVAAVSMAAGRAILARQERAR